MKIERYKHPLNAPCLCGSGLKFKRCCHGDYDLFGGETYKKFREHLEQANYEEALKLARRDITRYTILHKTNTAPHTHSKNKGVMWMLKLDLDALVDYRLILTQAFHPNLTRLGTS